MIRFIRRLLAVSGLAATLPLAAHAQIAEQLELHGAINAAYGRSADIPILGIPSSGTTDYRNITLQVRYHINDDDQFVLQLLNRRLGNSPLQAAIPDIAMHWAFWQRKSDWGTIKVGRAPMPRGLFNEIRFVGSVLPLYRPSFEVYGEGRETVDGLVANKRLKLAPGTSLDVNVFYGGNEVRTQVVTATGNSIRAYRGMPLGGTQLWLNLPFADTKFGAYLARYAINPDTGARGTRSEWLASGESKFGPATLRAEALRIYGTGPNQDRKSGYVQGVVQLAENVDVVSEYSITNNRVFQAAPKENLDVDATRDFALGVTYRLGGNALVRLERHEVHGYAFDRLVPFLIQAPTSTSLAPVTTGNYWLASFAVSF